MNPIKVFLDSSVIIAGLASAKGGSREILNLAELGFLIPVISEEIVREVVRNIERKLPACLAHYYQLFRILPFIMAEPSEDSLAQAKELINPHDALILASALSSRADWLISLDKHFLVLNNKELFMKIGTPEDFLESVLL
ncbi:putative toxin-antitoxin system toxin component, PIN family [Syntrophomonas wolfei]|jgi:putative PIN family toxin of toxin-antitoxin system|uniref:putative toxin-antitoxin system toxin component, PIN family n=1 Tax=Syntrophomonas wolfei TaxID=863 RepID=UPI0023F45734|nr:putative toxin-antitoxin system toxin component, PIN family [Syntrophomonas wolfei]